MNAYLVYDHFRGYGVAFDSEYDAIYAATGEGNIELVSSDAKKFRLDYDHGEKLEVTEIEF